jgi:hypothetical protein
MSESEAREFGEISFDIDAASSGSSGEAFSARPERRIEPRDTVSTPVDETASPVFKLLASPTLPELKHETRARLMMQSPTRLFFYWSVARRSFQALHKTLGGQTGDYTLALRLLNLTTDVEELHAVEAEGSWWFNAEPDNEYRAEIGFYSATRPFVRILFSNSITTPRKSPSPHSASESRWAITTHTFAEVLEASGFEEDAFEVIRSDAGQDLSSAFASHVGINESELAGLDLEELRRALAFLASGMPIEDLKWKIAAPLYALLEAHLAMLSAASIEKNIGIAASASEPEFETFSAVGGSLLNFPRRRYRPISSMNLR